MNGNHSTRLKEIIAVTNDKGGVGKTTTALNLALGLTEKPYRATVLVIDLDSQGNAAAALGWRPSMEKDKRTLFSNFNGTATSMRAYLSDYENCYYVPAGRAMLNVEPHLRSLMMPVNALKELLNAPIELEKDTETANSPQDVEKAENGTENAKFRTAQAEDTFDYILIDCPPSMGVLTMNAWVAANSILVPFQMEKFSFDGLRGIISSYRDVKTRANNKLRMRGILRTMYDSRLRLTREMDEILQKELGDSLLPVRIPKSAAVPRSQAEGGCLLLDDPKNAAAKAYAELLHILFA